ncbi:MAG: HEAT repeat domain-containing protein [Methanomicrobiaceae archaeon]|nr:HEAT repeat domain-containing protein [Methanomicrobiaceae archaeon]
MPAAEDIQTRPEVAWWVKRPTTDFEEVQASSAVAALVEQVLKGDTCSSLQAAEELAKVGAPAVGPLVQVFTNRGTTVRWSIAMVLAEVGSPAVKPLIGVMKNSGTECCRALTAAALLTIGDPAGVAAVGEALLLMDGGSLLVVRDAARLFFSESDMAFGGRHLSGDGR